MRTVSLLAIAATALFASCISQQTRMTKVIETGGFVPVINLPEQVKIGDTIIVEDIEHSKNYEYAPTVLKAETRVIDYVTSKGDSSYFTVTYVRVIVVE